MVNKTRAQVRAKKRRQAKLRNEMVISLIMALTIMAIITVVNATKQQEFEVVQAIRQTEEPEVSFNVIEQRFANSTVEEPIEPAYPVFTYSKDWDAEDDYLLAKIAMAEAEGCSTDMKVKVILTVLNRVHDNYFPDTIRGVIYQKLGNVYQFSPIGNGRWDRVKPNDDCWEALKIVKESQYDESMGALYFESCADADNWHSRNLEFLYEVDGLMRFYK